MNAQRLTEAAFLIGIAFGSSLWRKVFPHYPSARRADVIDNYFGTKVADPYRWMEDLNSPELKQWIDAENALAFGYLNALPQRDALKARITELWNYPKVTPPRYEGGHWFYSRNTGLQRQSVVFMRETLNSPETVVLDPNRPVAGRFDCPLRFCPVARRTALRVRSVSRRLGLVDVLRP